MKVTTRNFDSIYGLKKIQPNARPDQNPSGSRSVSVRQQSYAEIQTQLQAKKAESGYQNKLDPRIAIAITAANSDKVFSLSPKKDLVTDIIHDNSLNRGKSTNIEI